MLESNDVYRSIRPISSNGCFMMLLSFHCDSDSYQCCVPRAKAKSPFKAPEMSGTVTWQSRSSLACCGQVPIGQGPLQNPPAPVGAKGVSLQMH